MFIFPQEAFLLCSHNPGLFGNSSQVAKTSLSFPCQLDKPARKSNFFLERRGVGFEKSLKTFLSIAEQSFYLWSLSLFHFKLSIFYLAKEKTSSIRHYDVNSLIIFVYKIVRFYFCGIFWAKTPEKFGNEIQTFEKVSFMLNIYIAMKQ